MYLYDIFISWKASRMQTQRIEYFSLKSTTTWMSCLPLNVAKSDHSIETHLILNLIILRTSTPMATEDALSSDPKNLQPWLALPQQSAGGRWDAPRCRTGLCEGPSPPQQARQKKSIQRWRRQLQRDGRPQANTMWRIVKTLNSITNLVTVLILPRHPIKTRGIIMPPTTGWESTINGQL